MNHNDTLILVTGATGQQGGATARHLLAKGFRVRALTRDPGKPAAQALASQGAELAQGDLYDRASVDKALRGAYGVFSVQNFWLPDVGAAGEIRQGKLLADAAKAAGVRHFVYTSVGGAERNTGLSHFDSKWEIEQHIRSLGLPATILRPVFFMENHNWSREPVQNGTFPSLGLRPDRPLQMVAVDDIGAFAAMAFENPGKFTGQALELAGDELTERQTAETFARVIGRAVAVAQPTPQGGGTPDPEWMKMIAWFNDKGYKANIPALRGMHGGLMNLETWARKTGWAKSQ